MKGHFGIAGNEGADALANRGALMPEEPERDWEALTAALYDAPAAAADATNKEITQEDLDVRNLRLMSCVEWLRPIGSL